MLKDLLYGPARRGDLPYGTTLRPRELNIDTVLDALKIAKAILPGHDVMLFVYPYSGNRYIEPEDLPDLSTEDRLALVLRATRGEPRDPKGTMIGTSVLQVSLGGAANAGVGMVAATEDEQRALVAVVDVIEKQGKLLVQPRRLEPLLLPAVFVIGLVAWVVAIAQQLIPVAGAIAGWAAVILVGVLIARLSQRRVRELDEAPVAHRFEPVSYRVQRANRASTRRDVRVAVIASVAGAVAGSILTGTIAWLIGI